MIGISNVVLINLWFFSIASPIFDSFLMFYFITFLRFLMLWKNILQIFARALKLDDWRAYLSDVGNQWNFFRTILHIYLFNWYCVAMLHRNVFEVHATHHGGGVFHSIPQVNNGVVCVSIRKHKKGVCRLIQTFKKQLFVYLNVFYIQHHICWVNFEFWQCMVFSIL